MKGYWYPLVFALSILIVSLAVYYVEKRSEREVAEFEVDLMENDNAVILTVTWQNGDVCSYKISKARSEDLGAKYISCESLVFPGRTIIINLGFAREYYLADMR